MARDSQAALVALNRFGLGARGGASGDFLNAASDPRGFVKADLAGPSGVLLELPGLQSTPALAHALFEYQDEVKQAKAAQSASETAQPAEQKPRRSLGIGSGRRQAGRLADGRAARHLLRSLHGQHGRALC